jgi:hypothetical protein
VALIRVFVDSNELFPFSVMDLILTLAEDQLIEFVWSEELVDEWERVSSERGDGNAELTKCCFTWRAGERSRYSGSRFLSAMSPGSQVYDSAAAAARHDWGHKANQGKGRVEVDIELLLPFLAR